MGTLLIFSDLQRDNKTLQIHNAETLMQFYSVPNSTLDSEITETKIHNRRAPSAGHTWEGSIDCPAQGLQGK